MRQEWKSIDNLGAACNEMLMIAINGSDAEAAEFVSSFPRLSKLVLAALAAMPGITVDQRTAILKRFRAVMGV